MKRTLFEGTTVSGGIADRILVIAHGRSAPSREDWTQVCRVIAENHKEARGQLVLSLGGAPDAAQRKSALAQLPKGFVSPPVAVLTNDTMLRGVITALNWFLKDSHRSFKPDDIAGVAAQLHLSDDEAEALVAFARTLVPKS